MIEFCDMIVCRIKAWLFAYFMHQRIEFCDMIVCRIKAWLFAYFMHQRIEVCDMIVCRIQALFVRLTLCINGLKHC